MIYNNLSMFSFNCGALEALSPYMRCSYKQHVFAYGHILVLFH